MIVIAVVQGKGGVGKTTLAINLAGEIVSFGRSVGVVDADPQTVAKVRDVRRIDNGVSRCKIALIPTRVDLATEEGEQIRDELAELGEPVGPSLSYDIEFVRAFTTGQSVSSLPADASAAQDIKRVSHFLLRQVLPRAAAPAAD